ncbi:MAG: IPT/TIG domain-containing protein [Opitutaceae bacterium]
MSHTKAYSAARTILSWAGAAVGLALFAGCSTLTLTNLTPASLQENPSEIYTFTLRATPRHDAVVAGSVAPRIVVDGQSYPMKPSALGPNVYEFDYQLPPGRQEVAYYFLVDYKLEGNGLIRAAEAYTGLQHASVASRYVLSLESNRGPTGATIAVLGRGFTPQDSIQFNGTPAQTLYSSSTSLSFVVPGLPSGDYAVSLVNPAGTSQIGDFRIDATSVTASPSSLNLVTGQQETLTFNLGSPAPSGGLLLNVTTDIPESVIMPEVVVPEGETSVSIPVQGGRPGNGNLVLKGYGEGLTIPVTVTSR